jgi:hypothetical protein
MSSYDFPAVRDGRILKESLRGASLTMPNERASITAAAASAITRNWVNQGKFSLYVSDHDLDEVNM